MPNGLQDRVVDELIGRFGSDPSQFNLTQQRVVTELMRRKQEDRFVVSEFTRELFGEDTTEIALPVTTGVELEEIVPFERPTLPPRKKKTKFDKEMAALENILEPEAAVGKTKEDIAPLLRNIVRDVAQIPYFFVSTFKEAVEETKETGRPPVNTAIDLVKGLLKMPLDAVRNISAAVGVPNLTVAMGLISQKEADKQIAEAQQELFKHPLMPLYATGIARAGVKVAKLAEVSPAAARKTRQYLKETGDSIEVPLKESSRAQMELLDGSPSQIKNIPAPKEIVEFNSGLAPPKELANNVTTRIRQFFGFTKTAEPIYEWSSFRRIGKYDSEQFISKMERDIGSPEQMEFLTEALETKNLSQLSPKAKEYIPILRKYLDDAYDFMLKEGLYDQIGFIENYVPHIWEPPTHAVFKTIGGKGIFDKYFYDEISATAHANTLTGGFFETVAGRAPANWAGRLVQKNPHLKKRKLPTLEDGRNIGLVEKTKSLGDILRIYDSYRINTIANARLADFIRDMKDENGNPIMQRFDKAPAGWIPNDNFALRRATGFKNKEGKVIISKQNVKVNPEYAQLVNVAFGKPFSHPAIKALESVNAIAKFASLSLSLFHHFALFEAGIGAGIKPWKFKKGVDMIRNNPQFTRKALNAGLQIGISADVQIAAVRRGFEAVERSASTIPFIGKTGVKIRGREISLSGGVRGVRKGMELWNKGLWDYYHNGMKIMAYEKILNKEMKRAENVTRRPLEVEREVAQFVNDTFGGQNWELLMKDPRFIQTAHWVLLAPDWTLSVLRQFESPFNTGLRGRQGRQFWARSAFFFYTMSNMVNYVTTQHTLGQGRWMHQNGPGHNVDILLHRNEDESLQYLKIGKQFREPFNWIFATPEVLGRKLSPVLQIGIEQLTGRSTTGFPTGFVEEGKSIPEILKSLATGERGKAIASKFVPFSIKGNQAFFAFPTSRGMTTFRAAKLIEEAINSNDQELLRRTIQSAEENGLDVKRILGFAKANITRKLNKELQRR